MLFSGFLQFNRNFVDAQCMQSRETKKVRLPFYLSLVVSLFADCFVIFVFLKLSPLIFLKVKILNCFRDFPRLNILKTDVSTSFSGLLQVV